MSAAAGAVRGRLLTGDRWVAGTLTFESENGTIASIELEPDAPDAARLPYVAPGLIDLHIHGYGGADPLEDLAGMARGLARAGTTAFQPTLFPRAPARLGKEAEGVWSAVNRITDGARVVGLHLEGPFVNPERAGALPPEDLSVPSPAALRTILGPATGGGRGIRTVTLAPELTGARDLITELARSNVRVSLGHSRATAAEARAAARAGAVGATHLYNAMGPLHHREVGLAGFALSSDALFAEIIGDLVHVSAEAFELALAARGPAGLCLVSDAMVGAGTGCDVFAWHGRDHVIHAGTAYYPPSAPGEEPRLAGTAMGQLEMVRRLVERGVLDLADALTIASTTPALALGLAGELGALTIGARGDVIVLEHADLALSQVWLGGQLL